MRIGGQVGGKIKPGQINPTQCSQSSCQSEMLTDPVVVTWWLQFPCPWHEYMQPSVFVFKSLMIKTTDYSIISANRTATPNLLAIQQIG